MALSSELPKIDVADPAPPSGPRRSPPSLRGLPLVRALPSLVRDPLGFLVNARAMYGDVYTLDLGVNRAVLLHQPRHAHHVLRHNAANYRKGGPFWDTVRSLVGNGLAASEGDFWRRQRRMMQPHFHQARLSAIAARMQAAIREGLEPIAAAAEAGKPIDLVPAFTTITMRAIVSAVFGATIDRAEADKVGVELQHILAFVGRGLFLRAIPSWVPSLGRRRYKQAIAALDATVARAIEQRRRGPTPDGDLISLLLDLEDTETRERMTDAELRDEIMSIFVSGAETTSTALSWAAHFLSQEPDHARALQAEVDTVLATREPLLSDLPRLSQTRAVIEESLRLYPPAYVIPREALDDDEIDGWTIPKGTIVAPVVCVIHRHPDVWEDPDRFDPARFLPARAAERHPLAWLPFGAGQRTCLGKDFAMMESQLILAPLVQRFELSPVPGRATRLHVGVGMRPEGGVWATLRKRRPRIA